MEQMFLIGSKAFERLLRYWVNPIYHEIKALRRQLMASVEELNTAIDGIYDSLLPGINEIRDELQDLRDKAEGDGVTPDDLSSAIVRLSGVTNRVRDALGDLVSNDATPEPTDNLPELPDPLPEEPPVVSEPVQDVPVTEVNPDSNGPQ